MKIYHKKYKIVEIIPNKYYITDLSNNILEDLNGYGFKTKQRAYQFLTKIVEFQKKEQLFESQVKQL
jgi:hypothetical protein